VFSYGIVKQGGLYKSYIEWLKLQCPIGQTRREAGTQSHGSYEDSRVARTANPLSRFVPILKDALWVSLLIGSPQIPNEEIVSLHLEKEVEQVLLLPRSAWEAGVLPPEAQGSRIRFFDKRGLVLEEGTVVFQNGRFVPPPSVLEQGMPLWLTPKEALVLTYDAMQAG